MDLTADNKIAVRDLITKGLQIQEEISDLRGGLGDLIKKVATDIGCEPKVLKQALRVAKKGNLSEVQEDTENLEEVLRIAGRA
jgi:predicted regulator of amino acid metabolism with ACT domain